MASKRWMASMGGSPEKFGIALVRIMVGVVFLIHGYQKWFVWGPAGVVKMFGSMSIPPIGAYTAMTAELVCGGLLVLGLFTRLAAIPIAITMTVAIIKVHLPNGFFLTTYPVANAGYEYALTLGVAALGIVFAGPGAPAADNLLAGKR